MRSRCPLSAVSAATLAACGGSELKVFPPLKRTALPAGSALRPWSPTVATRAAPQLAAAGPGGSAFIALTNLDANYAPGGPGLLVRLQPDTGAQVVIPLGGADDRGCSNSGVVKNENGVLVAVCSGGFGADPAGRAIVEVNPATNAVARTAKAPAGFQPSAVAVAAKKIWVGDFNLPRVYSVDRTTFAVVDGADAAHPATDLPCAAPYTYVADLLVAGGDLFALCGAADGYLVRLDSGTGALKGDKVLVGAQPVAMALTGDGRIAVSNSTSGTLSLDSIGASALTVARDVVVFGKSAALQDVRARGSFLYTVTTGTNAVQKLDLAAKDQTRLVVAEQPTGDNSGPYSILPLDDNQAIVTNNLTGEVVGVNFSKTATSTTP